MLESVRVLDSLILISMHDAATLAVEGINGSVINGNPIFCALLPLVATEKQFVSSGVKAQQQQQEKPQKQQHEQQQQHSVYVTLKSFVGLCVEG